MTVFFHSKYIEQSKYQLQKERQNYTTNNCIKANFIMSLIYIHIKNETIKRFPFINREEKEDISWQLLLELIPSPSF